MSDTFITADEHYGHENIIQFCNRPFKSTEEMRETIIERHNAFVPNRRSFLTIHAGDMFWQGMPVEEAESIIKRLNGRHAFLYGNHDELMERNIHLRGYFEWVRGENKELSSHTVNFNKHRLIISHFAARVWQNSHKGSWHVYGHSHQQLPPLGKSFDIGVEGHNYEPWSLEEIAAKMETLTSHHIIPADKVWEKRPEGIIFTPASVAQTVEQGSCKAEVGGSTPPAGSTVHASVCGCGWCRAGWTRPTVMEDFNSSVALNHNLLERMGDA
jgi:calcineurin-like phosphoesterase family protein